MKNKNLFLIAVIIVAVIVLAFYYKNTLSIADFSSEDKGLYSVVGKSNEIPTSAGRARPPIYLLNDIGIAPYGNEPASVIRTDRSEFKFVMNNIGPIYALNGNVCSKVGYNLNVYKDGMLLDSYDIARSQAVTDCQHIPENSFTRSYTDNLATITAFFGENQASEIGTGEVLIRNKYVITYPDDTIKIYVKDSKVQNNNLIITVRTESKASFFGIMNLKIKTPSLILTPDIIAQNNITINSGITDTDFIFPGGGGTGNITVSADLNVYRSTDTLSNIISRSFLGYNPSGADSEKLLAKYYDYYPIKQFTMPQTQISLTTNAPPVIAQPSPQSTPSPTSTPSRFLYVYIAIGLEILSAILAILILRRRK